MVLLNAPRIRGYWANAIQYKMVDSITGTVCSCWAPELDDPDPRERMEFAFAEDWILEMHERFEARIKNAEVKKAIPRNDQHDMGKVLKDIKGYKEHKRETGNERVYTGLGGL